MGDPEFIDEGERDGKPASMDKEKGGTRRRETPTLRLPTSDI